MTVFSHPSLLGTKIILLFSIFVNGPCSGARGFLSLFHMTPICSSFNYLLDILYIDSVAHPDFNRNFQQTCIDIKNPTSRDSYIICSK